MQHLDEGTIHAWLDGGLDADEAARVERHVAECAECAAAVAEARGLVAGATRILAALDDAPSGVTPKPATFGAAASARQRQRSVWKRLRLTPVRAAAAAVVFLAAGTVLVMQNRSAERANVYQMADQPVSAPRPTVPVSATPQPASADSFSSTRPPAAAPKASAAPAPTRKETKLAQSRPVTEQVVVTGQSERSDAVSRQPRDQQLDSAAVRQRAFGAVGGATPRPAAMASTVRAELRTVSALNTRLDSYAGCYAVSGLTDSSSVLPPLLSLDTARADQSLTIAGGVAGRALRSVAQDRYSVSALTSDGRRPMANAYWQLIPASGARLTIGGPTPRNIDLRSALDSPLVQASPAKDSTRRTNAVTLRRVDCPSR